MIDASHNPLLTFNGILNTLQTPVTVFDRDLNIKYVNEISAKYTGVPPEELLGRHIFDLFPESDEVKRDVQDQFDRALQGETVIVEAQPYALQHADGSTKQYYWQVESIPFKGANGDVTHIIQVSYDVTSAIEAQNQRDLISRELDHRVKNLLTILNAIVNLSGSDSEPTSEFRAALSARLLSISSLHERLAKNNWTGLMLTEVIEITVDPFFDLASERVSIEGPPVPLAMKAARDAAMLLHENATNATKYGFLTQPDGKLKIRWNVDEAIGKFVFEWIEYGLEGIQQPNKEGFGALLSSSFPNMEVTWDFKPEGLHITMEIDLGRLSIDNSDTMV